MIKWYYDEIESESKILIHLVVIIPDLWSDKYQSPISINRQVILSGHTKPLVLDYDFVS